MRTETETQDKQQGRNPPKWLMVTDQVPKKQLNGLSARCSCEKEDNLRQSELQLFTPETIPLYHSRPWFMVVVKLMLLSAF